MPWGFLGPVSVRTRRGTRVTFFAGFVTIPLAAWSFWQLAHSATRPRAPPTSPLPPAREGDLSGR
jgi:hypothetical protein